MALTDKDIVITPNRGQSADPKIEFKGASSTLGPQTITLNVYPTSNGTLSFEGSAGQLFSITNSLTGTIYSVNDVSGIPSIEVLDTGLVKLAQYSGNVLVGTGTDTGHKLKVVGTTRIDGSNSQPLTISTSSSGPWAFGLIRTDTGADSKIFLHNPGSGSAWIFEHIPYFYNGGNYNVPLHNGNYGSYALPLSGGTLTGNLTMNGAGNSTSIIFGENTKQINVEGYWMMFKGHQNEGFRWQTTDGSTYTTRMQLTSSNLTLNTNGFIDFGPNTTWSSTLRVGGNGHGGSGRASVVTTDGNLHLDGGGSGTGLYLNYYVNGPIYATSSAHVVIHAGNYNSYSPTLTGGSASGTWGINITGNSATVGGYSVSTGGSANTIPTRNSSGYLSPANWIQFDGTYGLYAPTNDAHFHPNDQDYGSWRIRGTRNGWYGIYFDSGSTLMMNSSEVGFYRSGVGWQMWWSGGTGYVHKGNPGGGTQATILDSSNYTNYTTGIFLRAAGHPGYGDWNTFGNTQQTVHQIFQENFNAGTNTGSSNFPTSRSYSYGTLINFGANDSARAQVYISHAGNDLIFRGGWGTGSWQTWNRVLTDQNYTSWAPSLTGTGASGTWSISITGSAASAGSSPWSALTGTYREDYNIGFRPASAAESYAGFRFGTVGGDANAGYLLIRNGSDTDVYTQNGITLVADAGWLTLAQRTLSDKGVRIMSGAGSTERVKVTSAGDIQFVNGNSINYNTGRMIYGDTYAGSEPYNTGSIGRSSINIDQIFERRSGFIDVWASGGGTYTSGSTHDTGFQSMHYWDGTTGYGVQIAGNHGVRDTLKFRWRSSNGINPWYNILNSANYNSYSPTLTGGNASGTWGINISGNAATATSATDSTKLPLSGGTVTGPTYFVSNLGATSGSLSSPPLQAYSTGNNSAFMSFHKGGYYAVNFGLDSDNVLRIGGWSASANRWELDMSGNNIIPGRLTANAWTTSARNYSNEWIEFPNYSGLYSPNQGAHFYPNNGGSYGSWRIAGAKNGWYGIYFDSGSTLMMNSETLGFYREGYGWQFYWSAGTGYVSKGNPGGGTIATILESSNYTSYSPSLTGSGASGTWNINITGSAATATDSTKVPLTGGTMTGTLFINSKLRVNNASGPSDSTYGTAADIPMHMSGNTRTQTTFLIENTVNSSIDYPVIVIRRTLTPVGSRFGGMIRFADKNSSGTEISSQIYSFNRLTSQDLFLDAGSGTEDRVVLRAGSSSSMQVAENFIMNVKAAIYTTSTPAALDIDCKQSNYFTKTISADSTFTFSNVPAPSGFTIAYSFTLELTHTAGTVTWPASVRWPGNVLPSLTTGKTHLFMFVTDDSGSRWRGSFLSNYDN